MEFSFNLFKPHRERKPKCTEPLIAIKPSGRIVFNSKATELLDKQNFCMLGYDIENKALGVLPLETKETNAFPIKYAAKGAYVGAKKFFRFFGILPEQLIQEHLIVQDKYIGIKM